MHKRDFISKIRAQQLKLAKDIGVALFYNCFANSMHLYMDDPSDRSIDWKTTKQLFQDECKHHAILAIEHYTDWAGSTIFRSGNMELRQLPIPGSGDYRAIAERCGLCESVIERVVEYLNVPGTKIPLLGQMKPGQVLTVDKATLTKWASYYKW